MWLLHHHFNLFPATAWVDTSIGLNSHLSAEFITADEASWEGALFDFRDIFGRSV